MSRYSSRAQASTGTPTTKIWNPVTNKHGEYSTNLFLVLTTPENTLQHTMVLFVRHPKILHKHCFQFLLGPFFNFQEKLKTMLMQKFGLTNKEHYGMLWSCQLMSRWVFETLTLFRTKHS